MAVTTGYEALAAPRFELIPIRGMQEAAGHLPTGSVINVTCSPKHGLDRTLEAAHSLAGLGHRPIPHIAARLVRDRAHLTRVLDELARGGMDEVFVVGGDAAKPAGQFDSAAPLLEMMDGMANRPVTIGLPAYPEGHALISDAALASALAAKRAFGDYLVTQICFDPARIRTWLGELAADGTRLPVYIGLPGVMDPKQLLSISLRIGIGTSLRVLRRNQGMTDQMLGGAYVPDALVHALLPLFDTPGEVPLAGFHLNTFNLVPPLLSWQQRMLDELTVTEAG